jgi:hypothetical protein
VIKKNEPCIFIPLSSGEFDYFPLYIHRYMNSKSEDEKLAHLCEKTLTDKFLTLGLEYNSADFGEIKMDKTPPLCLTLSSDPDNDSIKGVLIPECYFINPPKEGLKRIKYP